MLLQLKKAKEILRRRPFKSLLTLQAGCLASVSLRFSLISLIFVNLQTFGHGHDFCFDGSKEGMFLSCKVKCTFARRSEMVTFLGVYKIAYTIIDCVYGLENRCCITMRTYSKGRKLIAFFIYCMDMMCICCKCCSYVRFVSKKNIWTP